MISFSPTDLSPIYTLMIANLSLLSSLEFKLMNLLPQHLLDTLISSRLHKLNIFKVEHLIPTLFYPILSWSIPYFRKWQFQSSRYLTNRPGCVSFFFTNVSCNFRNIFRIWSLLTACTNIVLAQVMVISYLDYRNDLSTGLPCFHSFPYGLMLTQCEGFF